MRSGVGPVEAVADVRVGVVARLRARHDELVREIFARVRGDGFARAGEEDAEYVAGLRAAVVAALDYVLEGIEQGESDGSPSTPPVPLVALEQARRAARVGVSLDTVLRRYVVGSALLGEFIMEEADRDGLASERGALRGVLRAQASGLDRLLQAITVAYGDELERVRRSPERCRYERVRGLLDGGTDEGVELDYELGGWHLGVIAAGMGAERAVRELAEGVDRRLLSVSHGAESVWAWIGGGERFEAFADLERVAGGAGSAGCESVVFALGEPARGLAGWRLTHRQAQAALVVALRRNGSPGNGSPGNGGPRNGSPPTPRGVTRYADVALLASALKDELLARALVDVYIAPLGDPRNGGMVLRETLRAYLTAERSVSSAAAALGVVRKTVESRLRTVEEKLGRTLHPCPVELEVALLLDELAAAPQSSEISITGCEIITYSGH
jgi:hypothetical protein